MITAIVAGLSRAGNLLDAIDLALGTFECQGRAKDGPRKGPGQAEGGERVLDERKLTVLRAIVEDYVSTTEPVGSKTLVDRHHFDVSPATIRNDMAVLEEQGFIAQPHTSAGRIPTEKGYRLFVDRLSNVKPLSGAERRAIETFLAGAYSLDDVVMRTVRLLVQLTRQVAVVQYPSLNRSAIRHIELVPLARIVHRPARPSHIACSTRVFAPPGYDHGDSRRVVARRELAGRNRLSTRDL